MRVRSGARRTMRRAISHRGCEFGYAPFRMRSTLYCCCVIPVPSKMSSNTASMAE